MDPSLVDRFITGAVPAISNYGKISLRTHILAGGGFPVATGVGIKVPISVEGGSQNGIIIKRIDDRMEVRLVSGFVLNGSVQLSGGGAFGVGAARGDVGFNPSLWNTHGVTLHFPIRIGEDGKEDFSAVHGLLRALLLGDLPTTEAWARAASTLKSPKRKAFRARCPVPSSLTRAPPSTCRG